MTEAPVKPKRYTFKAEIQQLLDLLIHSVYASKDIFVRELVSNASDALEKIRFAEVQGQEVADAGCELKIEIETHDDEGKKRLVVRDTGIGMTADEVRENIGVIAHSGATAFLEQLKQQEKGEDLSLIGRFGVGFYSVFMVAEKVVLTSRSASPDAEPVRWICKGAGSYTIEKVTEAVPRGTSIEIWLKEDEAQYATAATISGAIRKHSNFVAFPILVDGERVNETTALWREPESSITDEQYREFYKFLTFAPDDPLLRLHFSADVPLQFSALLFVPGQDPESMGFGEGEVSLQLYVRRVLIDPQNKDLLPKFLRFVKGVIESEDLPLNVSRETLQENRFVLKMRETLTRKLLGLFEKLAKDDPEEYCKFWTAFGSFLKEGANDFAWRDRLHPLLRFESSAEPEVQVGLDDLVDRMPDTQKAIYYLSGPSREALDRDPRLELFRRKGTEVLYLYEFADEFVLGNLGTYRDKPLVSADQVKPEDLGAEPEKDDEKKASAEALEPLVDRFTAILGERVTAVRSSERLVDSPACLVSDDGMSGHMDKMFRMINKDSELPKRTLELNPKHALIQSLVSIVGKSPEDPFVALACEQLFEGAMLMDGYLTDPHRFVGHMNEVLQEAARAKE